MEQQQQQVYWWKTQGKVCVVCYAEWDTGPSRQMIQVCESLEGEVIKVDVEKNEALCEAYGVSVVPTLLVLKDGKLVGKAEGALKPVDIVRFVNVEEEEEEEEGEREDAARRKFEQKIAKIKNDGGLVDPKDPAVRLALQQVSDTFPQAWMNGQLVGHSKKHLEDVDERIRFLISRSRIIAFVKGTPDAPRCGFSRTICGLLKERHVEFDSYDILKDQDLRQQLKVFSNWPTFPQIYVDSKFVGGLDIISQIHQDAGDDDQQFLEELAGS